MHSIQTTVFESRGKMAQLIDLKSFCSNSKCHLPWKVFKWCSLGKQTQTDSGNLLGIDELCHAASA